IDELGVAPVEIVVGEDVGDAVEGVGHQHQPAEHGLFGFDRLWRHAQLLDPAVGAPLETVPFETAVAGAESLACAHQFGDSPVSDGHRSRPAPAALQVRLWITGGHRKGCDCAVDARLPPLPQENGRPEGRPSGYNGIAWLTRPRPRPRS